MEGTVYTAFYVIAGHCRMLNVDWYAATWVNNIVKTCCAIVLSTRIQIIQINYSTISMHFITVICEIEAVPGWQE